MIKKFLNYALFLVITISLTGCGTTAGLQQKNREQTATIINLTNEIERLNIELDKLEEAKAELAEAKLSLERKLEKEIAKGELEVGMAERGLVVTMVAEVLFDPGKTVIKVPSRETLTKIASVLNSKELRSNFILVEGHTDNVPIKYSGYKSNWELSTARATEVLHFLIDKCSTNPERMSATGYGKFRPRDTNETSEGRARNRRVELIILPRKLAEVVVEKKPKFVK